MNQFVARAVLIGGRRCNWSLSAPSPAAAAAAVVVRSFDDTAVHCWASIGGAQWRRAMSSAAERTSAVAEKDRKETAVAEKEKEESGVLVSSYWGISRSKITREDGTEWPWNCFMVIWI